MNSVADGFYQQACELEVQDPGLSVRFYERALEMDLLHADSHVNLGRLLHERGDLEKAEQHYRFALFVRPEDPVAGFNLATVLEDLGETEEAIAQYQEVIALRHHADDAHYNLSRLYEQRGDALLAFRHLKEHCQLTRTQCARRIVSAAR